ncbi:SAM-dependent methyltransferase [Streptomyces sp. NPDC048442]|uniref:THUMP-like domain-containing protein n=1 Tax=Streptomyces sp. NPDC048442 TaxID=3154823 RepID=UPI00342E8DEC
MTNHSGRPSGDDNADTPGTPPGTPSGTPSGTTGTTGMTASTATGTSGTGTPATDTTSTTATGTTATEDAALAAFRALLAPEGQALLAELRDYDPAQALALATRLRRDHPAELVSAALAQARLRQRAAVKFGAADAHRMYFTPNGVEQSTRRSVADYRAARFRGLTPGPSLSHVLDLCGGIGGDALAMARAGLAVTAVDLDPAACLAARANAQALLPDPAALTVVQADVLTYDLTGAQSLFIDPARRSGARGRIFDPEAYSPPLSFSIDAVRKVGTGAIKIAPGIPHELVPDDFEAEWISDNGDVKEAVLWHAPSSQNQTQDQGQPQPQGQGQDQGHAQNRRIVGGARRATLLPSGATLVGRGLPNPDVRKVGRYLYEPDGAVIRAHLVAEAAEELEGGLIDETIAYITADALRPTPYATPYEITDQLPFGVKKLKALLREREVGILTVKKRGSAVEPEELRKKMKLSGKNSATVFLTRVAGAPTILIGHPA